MKIENLGALARKNESNDKYLLRNIELSMPANRISYVAVVYKF
jgi:hypothetical protein